VNQAFAVIEHDFNNGLTFKNSTMWANYDRGYRNIFPGTSSVGNPTPPLHAPANQFYLTGYQNQTNRENLFNQSDFTYKTWTGPIFHTASFGAEVGRQAGYSRRDSAVFQNTGTTFEPVDPLNPTFFGPVDFVHHFTANPASPDGVLTADNFGTYVLHTASAYAQDQIDLTRWLQLFVGARFDHFALDATNLNDNSFRSRTDDKVSPRAALIFKPAANMSFYGSYSISYLPASGDQFSSLTNATLILEPQKFENKEIGFKWNIDPRLLYTAAIYQLERTGVPIPDPNNNGFSLPNGEHRIKGFETSLTGYMTKDWQTTLGYAYTDARLASTLDASKNLFAGNRVQLVPYNQVSLWNKYQFNSIWAGGLGVIYFSDSYAASDDLVRLPGFVRVDAALYAKINRNWRVQLNVENIFDKGYWASADGNNNLSPGQGRTFKMSTIATF
jgi:catecholate siderophore receptor